MSAEVLREAARLMRERAELVIDDRGTWFKAATLPELTGQLVNATEGAFVQSWHPVVALAVADWLDATAAEHEADSGNATVDGFFNAFDTAPDIAALAVARAYLGLASP